MPGKERKKVGPAAKRKGLSKPKKPRVRLRTKGMKKGIYGIEYMSKAFGPIMIGPKKKK